MHGLELVQFTVSAACTLRRASLASAGTTANVNAIRIHEMRDFDDFIKLRITSGPEKNAGAS
jgi:hypothetical protein